MLKKLLLLLVFVILTVSTQAQNAGVYVTTQDFTVLRAGPGERWERLTVLPPGTTLRATGRTVDTRWFQVAYEGTLEETASDRATIDGVTYGWVAFWLLKWSGDILELPLGGVETIRTARRSNPTIEIGPNTLYYHEEVDPSRLVTDTVDEITEVELTGRIGSSDVGYYWLQFELNGQFYWTATWEVGDHYTFSRLTDGSYRYSYGRLLGQLRREIARNRTTLNTIGGRWRALDRGEQTTCNNIPAYAFVAEENFLSNDLRTVPLFNPAHDALLDAITNTNTAIDKFKDVCARQGEDRYVSPEEIQSALDNVREAERKLTLITTLISPFGRRDPVLGNAD